jgi:hypothetical protein
VGWEFAARETTSDLYNCTAKVPLKFTKTFHVFDPSDMSEPKELSEPEGSTQPNVDTRVMLIPL